MAKPLSRPVAKKNDLDLTPPEEIRARRIKRFVLVGGVIACVLGVAIYFAAAPVGGAIKGWQSRRLAREAFALIEQSRWSDANAKARDALFLRPTEPESWRAIARVASRTNQWSAALEWWQKVDDAKEVCLRIFGKHCLENFFGAGIRNQPFVNEGDAHVYARSLNVGNTGSAFRFVSALY